MTLSKLAAIILAGCIVVSLAACNDSSKKASPTSTKPSSTAASTPAPVTSAASTPRPTAPPEGTEAPFEGAKDPVEAPAQASGAALLADVRADEHSTYDRITFEFSADGLPGYRVEYVPQSEVTQCGSGQAAEVPGTTFLKIRLAPANAHDAQGAPTTSQTQVAPNLAQTCDFEAVVVWVLGLNGESDFRVLSLSDPPRIAVDVAHQKPQ